MISTIVPSLHIHHQSKGRQGNDHTPWSDNGAELFIVFDGKDGRYLDNFLEDGTVIKLDMPLLKAYEGITQAEADQLDVMSLVEIIPPVAA